MDFLYTQLIAGKQKAIVGFIATAVAAYAAKHGLNLDMTLKDALEACLWGLLGLFGVYIKRNRD
jgi:hypothetical protein